MDDPIAAFIEHQKRERVAAGLSAPIIDASTLAVVATLVTGPARPLPRGVITHPARYTPVILESIAPLIEPGTWVHDPFAGTGERLGQLADRHGWIFTGTEIEPEWIIDPRVSAGDSTDPDTYPARNHVIVTSPVYPNGMADHFAAADSSRRNTYRAHLARTRGQDRALHVNNQGRYGYRGRGARSLARLEYWRLARDVVARWTARRAFVNVKDFTASGIVEPVVDQWSDVLGEHGYDVTDRLEVPCPGNRFGANSAERIDHEVVLVAANKFPNKQ